MESHLLIHNLGGNQCYFNYYFAIKSLVTVTYCVILGYKRLAQCLNLFINEKFKKNHKNHEFNYV